MAKPVKPANFGKSEKRSQQKHSSKSKTAKEIVKRHLSDENDKITHDDFENLRIDLSLPHDNAHEPLAIPEKKERPKDEEKDNDTLTPWDVISE
jgi:hypothetical protein